MSLREAEALRFVRSRLHSGRPLVSLIQPIGMPLPWIDLPRHGGLTTAIVVVLLGIVAPSPGYGQSNKTDTDTGADEGREETEQCILTVDGLFDHETERPWSEPFGSVPLRLNEYGAESGPIDLAYSNSVLRALRPIDLMTWVRRHFDDDRLRVACDETRCVINGPPELVIRARALVEEFVSALTEELSIEVALVPAVRLDATANPRIESWLTDPEVELVRERVPLGIRRRLGQVRLKSYISRFEINQTGTQPIAEFRTERITLGSRLEVRPRLSPDRRRVDLEAVWVKTQARFEEFDFGEDWGAFQLPVVSEVYLSTRLNLPFGEFRELGRARDQVVLVRVSRTQVSLPSRVAYHDLTARLTNPTDRPLPVASVPVSTSGLLGFTADDESESESAIDPQEVLSDRFSQLKASGSNYWGTPAHSLWNAAQHLFVAGSDAAQRFVVSELSPPSAERVQLDCRIYELDRSTYLNVRREIGPGGALPASMKLGDPRWRVMVAGDQDVWCGVRDAELRSLVTGVTSCSGCSITASEHAPVFGSGGTGLELKAKVTAPSAESCRLRLQGIFGELGETTVRTLEIPTIKDDSHPVKPRERTLTRTIRNVTLQEVSQDQFGWNFVRRIPWAVDVVVEEQLSADRARLVVVRVERIR